jgi:hypothetical protein
LPGVVVIAAAHDGRVLGSATTDAVGAFVFEALPAIPVRLQFQLDGFSPAVSDITVVPSGNVQVKQRLTVAARSEAVTVLALRRRYRRLRRQSLPLRLRRRCLRRSSTMRANRFADRPGQRRRRDVWDHSREAHSARKTVCISPAIS